MSADQSVTSFMNDTADRTITQKRNRELIDKVRPPTTVNFSPIMAIIDNHMISNMEQFENCILDPPLA